MTFDIEICNDIVYELKFYQEISLNCVKDIKLEKITKNFENNTPYTTDTLSFEGLLDVWI